MDCVKRMKAFKNGILLLNSMDCVKRMKAFKNGIQFRCDERALLNHVWGKE
jgi:hypothetical protein